VTGCGELVRAMLDARWLALLIRVLDGVTSGKDVGSEEEKFP
jgi:hypothetical protein